MKKERLSIILLELVMPYTNILMSKFKKNSTVKRRKGKGHFLIFSWEEIHFFSEKNSIIRYVLRQIAKPENISRIIFLW